MGVLPRSTYTAVVLQLFALAVSSIPAQAQVIANASKTPITSSQFNHSTCPSRSLNYITQTLTQQCLTTAWASKSASQDEIANKPALTLIDAIGRSEDITTAVTTLQTLKQVDSDSLPAPTSTIITSGSSSGSPSSPLAAELIQTSEDPQTEAFSPLDNANFLSFEEWKRQNLAKGGQSTESLGIRAEGNEPRRRPGGINNALDSLGEDTEIEIDFGGFVNPGYSAAAEPSAKNGHQNVGSSAGGESRESVVRDDNSSIRKKGKDAGKTCKERSNYASFDCAASMLKTNTEGKGSNAVLVENRDSYMLNICIAKNKFFIVELCDAILIDTVVLANFEFFSSIFRTFKVSVSDRYPVKAEKWKDLGTYEARNSREVQAFLIETPLIWARYLRVEFLTHFGNEYYCPVSLLRVHGTTMMEEFNHELKKSNTEDDNDNEVGESEEEAGIHLFPGVVSAETLKDPLQEVSTTTSGVAILSPILSANASTRIPSNRNINFPIATNASRYDSSGFSPHNLSISRLMEEMLSVIANSYGTCELEETPIHFVSQHLVSAQNSQPATSTQADSKADPVIVPNPTQTNHTAPAQAFKPLETSSLSNTQAPPPSHKGSSQHKEELAKLSDPSSIIVPKTPSSSIQPQAANPTTQESFFKSVHKRLQLLESNSTLSLQYIEEQSWILRDAFSKVEKRQLAKSTSFLETLNTTVLTELRDFRNQYDQIWQSTVLELSSQRELSQHEVFALSARLSLLADEIVFQKRMVILQFILILLCLGLAIFSRSGPSATHLELPPLVHNAIYKSSVSLSRDTPQFESPPGSPSSTRPSSRYGLFRGLTHRRGPSNSSPIDRADDGSRTPAIEYSPPTPVSQGSPRGHSRRFAQTGGEEDSFPHAEDAIRQTKSSPATPSGQRVEQREYVEGTVVESYGG